MNVEWEKRASDFFLGIILYLITVIQIDIIAFCLGERDAGRGPLYPIVGFGQIVNINLWHDHFLDICGLLCSLLQSYYISTSTFLLQAFPRDFKLNLKLSKIKPLHAEWLVKVYSYTDMQDRYLKKFPESWNH